jgi:hypothetical protein
MRTARRMRTRRRAPRLLVAGVVALAGIGGAIAHASAQSSEQVVFSGTGATNVGPFGNWIWCEADSTNPYSGACSGSIYFYAQHLTKHVSGHIEEPSEGRYTMIVASADHSIVCQLHNPNEAVRGPHNTVTIACSAPAASGSSSNEVVNVTGP